MNAFQGRTTRFIFTIAYINDDFNKGNIKNLKNIYFFQISCTFSYKETNFVMFDNQKMSTRFYLKAL